MSVIVRANTKPVEQWETSLLQHDTTNVLMIEEEIRSLGREGWHLAAVVPIPGSTKLNYWLQRRVTT